VPLAQLRFQQDTLYFQLLAKGRWSLMSPNSSNDVGTPVRSQNRIGDMEWADVVAERFRRNASQRFAGPG
jgi:hypothetical protein